MHTADVTGTVIGDRHYAEGIDLSGALQNKGLQFTDPHGCVQITGIDLPAETVTGYSFAVWLKPDVVDKFQFIFIYTKSSDEKDMNRVLLMDEKGMIGHHPLNNGDLIDFDMQPNEWYFVVVTKSPQGVRNIYINGAEISSPLDFHPLEEPEGALYLGGYPDEERRLRTRGFSGVMDEVSIWKRELKKHEVQALYEIAGSE